jgi:hypothetical protein
MSRKCTTERTQFSEGSDLENGEPIRGGRSCARAPAPSYRRSGEEDRVMQPAIETVGLRRVFGTLVETLDASV